MFGNNVSHAMNKTRRRFDINLIKKRFYIPEEDKWITLKIKASVLKTINKKGISAVIKDAKAQAADIIEQAKKRAVLIVDEETVRGQEEREKIIAQGHSEIESERNRVTEELRKQVATLAVVGAERILEREINQAAHSDIVEKLVAEL